MRIVLLLGTVGLLLGALNRAAAQQQAAAPAPAANAPKTLSQALGLYTFPAKGQTPEQQSQDEQQCYDWAKDQTKIDPATLKTNPDSAAKAAQAKVDSAAQGAAVKGAAKGAAGGAVIGAVAGDAGEGAGIGAAAGAMAGRRAKKEAKAQAGNQGVEANKKQVQQQLDTFKKAMTACLQGRGYTVQ